MTKINYIYLINKGLFIIFTMVNVHAKVFADEALRPGVDCSEVSINYTDDPDMTQSEKIAAMDRAFFESIERFELCNLTNQSNASSQSAGGGGEASADGSESSVESAVSPLMTGTETESSLQFSDAIDDSIDDSGTNDPDTSEDIIKEELITHRAINPNGAVPEDIPAVNNDGVVAAQIRRAAELEEEPIKKQKLWNEYRKYKGLPIKNNKSQNNELQRK